ncbi:MAG: hypothetical protein AAB582_02775 [Patescibacteria group bacterium]
MRLYVPDPLSQYLVHPLFEFRYPTGKTQRGLFREQLPPNFFEEVEYVDLSAAEAIVLAHNFNRLDDAARAYIQRYADMGEASGLPVFVFAHADFADRLHFDPRVYVFRYSLYRRTKTKRDIMTPTLVEDLGRNGITLREKQEVPLISFCGRAAVKSLRTRVRMQVSVMWYEALGFFDCRFRAYLPGVYWRVRAMRACTSSALVRTHFIVRRTFSGHPASIELDPSTARREFIDTIINSDFVLAPKGDGNYSNRFQEALSLGRLPLYIETESVLPLEGVIEYDRIMVRVPMEKVTDAPVLARAYYDALSRDEYVLRQKEARQVFERYIRPDAFYRYVFTVALPGNTLETLNS